MIPFAEIVFWTSILIIFYTYAGYPILLIILTKPKISNSLSDHYVNYSTPLPSVALIIAAYNEEKILERKIHNSLEIDYPQEKFNIILITDGSDDGSNDIVSQYPQIKLLYEPQRKGKLAAMNRAVGYTRSEIIVFSDANALLNPESVKRLISHYSDAKIGGVAGEKKIQAGDSIAGGEGAYWRYESYLKKLDAKLYSVVGAAGELFSIRTSLYVPLNENIILDDFVQSLLLCKRGYRVQYEPGAFAIEQSSLSIADERERKIRISAGGFQAIGILKALLNIFRYRTLSFQYISHRVLRWTLCPLSLFLAFMASAYLIIYTEHWLYRVAFAVQVLFYLAAVAGSSSRWRIFYLPFYFCFMNYCAFAGLIRFARGRQQATWQKASRN